MIYNTIDILKILRGEISENVNDMNGNRQVFISFAGLHLLAMCHFNS